MDVDQYLQRIGYGGAREPTLETLRGLHLRHLESVPFENLDVQSRRPIILDEAAFFEKIVRGRRGGFCYELNGLFAACLRTLGFQVTYLSGRVASEGRWPSCPDFDHLLLEVSLDGPWLRVERVLGSAEELEQALLEHFGIPRGALGRGAG